MALVAVAFLVIGEEDVHVDIALMAAASLVVGDAMALILLSVRHLRGNCLPPCWGEAF